MASKNRPNASRARNQATWDERLSRMRLGLETFFQRNGMPLPPDYAQVNAGNISRPPQPGDIGAFWPTANFKVFAYDSVQHTTLSAQLMAYPPSTPTSQWPPPNDPRAYYNWPSALVVIYARLHPDIQMRIWGAFEALSRTLNFQYLRANGRPVSRDDLQKLEEWVDAMGVNGW